MSERWDCVGMVSVSFVDASNPRGREEEGQGRRKETPVGPFDENGWVLGRGEKFRMIKMGKEKPGGNGSAHFY